MRATGNKTPANPVELSIRPRPDGFSFRIGGEAFRPGTPAELFAALDRALKKTDKRTPLTVRVDTLRTLLLPTGAEAASFLIGLGLLRPQECALEIPCGGDLHIALAVDSALVEGIRGRAGDRLQWSSPLGDTIVRCRALDVSQGRAAATLCGDHLFLALASRGSLRYAEALAYEVPEDLCYYLGRLVPLFDPRHDTLCIEGDMAETCRRTAARFFRIVCAS